MSLYPKNSSQKLNPELFRNPTSEYRGAPFWSWNTKLQRDRLLSQVDALREMGFGGAHIHCRTGLDTEYMGEEFLGHVRACVEKARQEGMLMWLYDEDRWPSGFAGGLATKEERFRQRHLLFTKNPAHPDLQEFPHKLLGCYEVCLQNGRLASYRRLKDGEATPQDAPPWSAYLLIASPTAKGATPRYNNQTYIDTLSRAAMQKFVEVTHEAYFKAVGEHFGSVIPAIFTDEPQFFHNGFFKSGETEEDVRLAFTDDFPVTYQKAYGQDLLDHLPEIFWELPVGATTAVRYRYFDHVSERFASAFADTLGEWCTGHNIALTGHMMSESSLESQSLCVGEAMRSYRSFQIPGIDMLCDSHEYSTAKQAQSAAHQYGCPGVMSELYGVTDWQFDFVGHKGQGDWQAALGVTVRVHHLAWVSMAGEAKRDYPAAIDYHSPWYREYPLIENHYARLNTVLTRGNPHVRVGVLHPIESYWICRGPMDQTKTERQQREADFENIIQWLLFGLVDYDFICESLLPSQCNETGKAFKVGAMQYDAVVIPSLRTIRSTTLEWLEKFADAGGTVIFAGEIPSLVDALPSSRAQQLAERSQRVAFTNQTIVDALEPFRDVDLRLREGGRTDKIISQLRDDGADRIVFLCNTARREGFDTQVRLRGDWSVTLLDTLTGKITPMSSHRERGHTVFKWTFAGAGSALFKLTPGNQQGGEVITNNMWRDSLAIGWNWMAMRVIETPEWADCGFLKDPVPITLSEPNVLLLDQAEWRMNDEPWQPREEILRIDDALRNHLGLPLRGDLMAQPWANPAPAPVLTTVSLRFTVKTVVEIPAPLLALEELASAKLFLNGTEVQTQAEGYFVDESIQTVPLPALSAGTHEIMVVLPFTRKTNLEWCYLLGDFGVEVKGRHVTLTPPITHLTFGDWVHQGLPFYAGNVTYHCTMDGGDRELALHVPKFRAPLLSVELDGQPCGKIAFSPFLVDLGRLAPGQHQVAITAFGNRANAFGALHNWDDTWIWPGPPGYHTTGEQWAYEYHFKPMGILCAPVLRNCLKN